MSYTVAYADFWQFTNLGLRESELLNPHTLVLLPASTLTKLTHKTTQAIKQVAALDPVLQVALLEPLLARAQEVFYTAPWSDTGSFTGAVGALQYYYYASHAGLMYYLSNAKQVNQARVVVEKPLSGMLFLVANLLVSYCDWSKRVQISSQHRCYTPASANLEHWLTELMRTPSRGWAGIVSGGLATSAKSTHELTPTACHVSYLPSSSPSLASATSADIAELQHYLEVLVPPALAASLSAVFPTWRSQILALLTGQDQLSHLYNSLCYACTTAERMGEQQLRLTQHRKLLQNYRKEFALNRHELTSQLSRAPLATHLPSYLRQQVAYWQLQQELLHQGRRGRVGTTPPRPIAVAQGASGREEARTRGVRDADQDRSLGLTHANFIAVLYHSSLAWQTEQVLGRVQLEACRWELRQLDGLVRVLEQRRAQGERLLLEQLRALEQIRARALRRAVGESWEAEVRSALGAVGEGEQQLARVLRQQLGAIISPRCEVVHELAEQQVAQELEQCLASCTESYQQELELTQQLLLAQQTTEQLLGYARRREALATNLRQQLGSMPCREWLQDNEQERKNHLRNFVRKEELPAALNRFDSAGLGLFLAQVLRRIQERDGMELAIPETYAVAHASGELGTLYFPDRQQLRQQAQLQRQAQQLVSEQGMELLFEPVATSADGELEAEYARARTTKKGGSGLSHLQALQLTVSDRKRFTQLYRQQLQQGTSPRLALQQLRQRFSWFMACHEEEKQDVQRAVHLVRQRQALLEERASLLGMQQQQLEQAQQELEQLRERVVEEQEQVQEQATAVQQQLAQLQLRDETLSAKLATLTNNQLLWQELRQREVQLREQLLVNQRQQLEQLQTEQHQQETQVQLENLRLRARALDKQLDDTKAELSNLKYQYYLLVEQLQMVHRYFTTLARHGVQPQDVLVKLGVASEEEYTQEAQSD